MINIVPQSKNDIHGCRHLNTATDAEVIAVLPELLTWLKDFNWPVAPIIKQRLCTLNDNIDFYLLSILQGEDDVWKYWIVEELLASMKDKLSNDVIAELTRIARSPSKGELEERVNDAAIELVQSLRQ